MATHWKRREFVRFAALAPVIGTAAVEDKVHSKVGLVSATLAAHQEHRVERGIAFLDLPKIAREELGMEVLDLNTMNFPSWEPALLERFRAQAEKVGIPLTNLKLNQRGVQIGSPDADERASGMKTYRDSIDAAALLGLRWVRPLPTAKAPNRALMIDSLRELSDYASGKGIQVLVENFGWLQTDPEGVAQLIRDCDCGLAASPDTGNWISNEIRYEGLARTFTLAATCDFKAKSLGPEFQHGEYDLRRCFQIGWDAGFRGPWCIEHGNPDLAILYRELRWLREQLEAWIQEVGQKA